MIEPTTMKDPFVIHPYYTGRDKGAIRDPQSPTGAPLTFLTPGRAWKHVFTILQPDDVRACDNYRVIRLSEYQ